jgi:hypothetical protein
VDDGVLVDVEDDESVLLEDVVDDRVLVENALVLVTVVLEAKDERDPFEEMLDEEVALPVVPPALDEVT